MKLTNFASLDPFLRARKIRGLRNVAKQDKRIWEEFTGNWEALAYQSQRAIQQLTEKSFARNSALEPCSPIAMTEGKALRRVRLVQGFFREAVLGAYESQCAMCDLTVSELLVAGHIIPWHASVARRADPTNGLCLCVLHDRAFDQGLIAINDKMRICLSRRIKRYKATDLFKIAFISREGARIRLPSRFLPDYKALRYHYQKIFEGDW
jgi:predicted restriction endonuclease